MLKTKVDAITFQIREPSFYERPEKKHLRLEKDFYMKAALLVKSSGKSFGVALSDLSMVDYFDQFVDFYKILSKDLGQPEFVDGLINKTDKKIFQSTGMSSMEQISNFIDSVSNKITNVSLIHTQLSYAVEDVNLNAIWGLQETFDVPVSFGNHCENSKVLYLSLAFKPSAIFVYVKGEKDIKYPDDKHSVKLSETLELFDGLKVLRGALGKNSKEQMNNKIKDQT